jgi:type I restriction enzyme S subunit
MHEDQSAWKRRSLASLAEYLNGAAFKPSDWGEDGLPIVRIQQINDPSAPTDHYSGVLAPENHITDGDVIFSWSATLKAVMWHGGDAALNQHLFKVVPRAGVDKVFLLYVLDHNMGDIALGSQGSTMKHIRRGELQRYFVQIPERESEQRRIGEILSTVDEAIEQTAALIAKYERIRAGMTQDLFTRGVLPDASLRPPRQQAPHLYKETVLGWVPKDWDWDYLGNATSKIVDGVHHTPRYVEDGIHFITVKNLTSGPGIDFSDASHIRPEDHYEFIKRADPTEGDVLVTKDGTLGVSRMVEASHPDFSIFVSVALLRPDRSRLIPRFLHSFFDSKYYEPQLGTQSAGTGLRHIHLEHFRQFKIPLPRLEEQELIVDSITWLERSLSLERERNTNLLDLRRGLSNDLLSGRVRVPLEETVAL